MSLITASQIKKIHALKNSIRLNEDNYRALLFRFGAESSKELSKNEAVNFIKELTQLEKEIKSRNTEKKPTGVHSTGRLIYFNRREKATDNQIDYIAGLWIKVSEAKDYKSLMWFIKRVTKKFYIHLESMTLKEASHIIVALEKWNKQKEVNL